MNRHYLIHLEDERGVVLQSIVDAGGLLDAILIPNSAEHSGLLKYVDPYGTTTLNELQAEALQFELENVRGRIESEEHKLVFTAIKSLLQRCSEEPHLYLKIYGD